MSSNLTNDRSLPSSASAAVGGTSLLLLGLLLVATNFRGPVTGVAPVLGQLREAFALTPAEAGLLTTLPLLAFGIVSPFAALFAREYGLERSLFASLLLIAGGVLLRSAGLAWCLYLGTAVIGVGIAVGNVLLPSLVKRDFPAKVATITGACALTMGVSAALMSAAAVPVAAHAGWQAALGMALVLPVLAALVWSRQLSQRSAPAPGTASPPHGGPVWHSAIAWQVTLFIGTNSLLYYLVIAWLPTILTSAGLSATTAGSLHGVMQLATAVPGLFLGPLIGRFKDQKLIAALLSGLLGLGLLGLALWPAAATLWAAMFGFASGGTFVLALIFMGLRTRSPQQAATLSGMAQCVGYLLAAGGPSAAGWLHDAIGSWTGVLLLAAAMSVVMGICGVLAGRDRTIGGAG